MKKGQFHITMKLDNWTNNILARTYLWIHFIFANMGNTLLPLVVILVSVSSLDPIFARDSKLQNPGTLKMQPSTSIGNLL